MDAAAQTADPSLDDIRASAQRAVRRRSMMIFGVLFATLAYFVYAWQAFEVSDLIAKAKVDNAILLGSDSFAYKVHVVKDLRRGGREVAVEGERTATYAVEPANRPYPGWMTPLREDDFDVDLGGGVRVVTEGGVAVMTVPDVGEFVITATANGVDVLLPEGMSAESDPALAAAQGLAPLPEWVRLSEKKFEARPVFSKRLIFTRSKIEAHRYFWGWENFFFQFRSPLATFTGAELWALAWSAERLEPEMSNAGFILDEFLSNPDWQHGIVFTALLETILMALLGTFAAVVFGLPLAFLAARNFTSFGAVRFVVRRLFDFLRGIDMLIWSLIFIRAFGLGPLTGALAIAFTDTGTLGKLFSEALENIDKKQVEGVRATGANNLQRYRFGVIPQLLPVLVSQTLYFLESNTRSATVIGALGAGGIGLVLVETMKTARDWENVLYIIILTIAVVVLMDMLSSWLRRRLIDG